MDIKKMVLAVALMLGMAAPVQGRVGIIVGKVLDKTLSVASLIFFTGLLDSAVKGSFRVRGPSIHVKLREGEEPRLCKDSLTSGIVKSGIGFLCRSVAIAYSYENIKGEFNCLLGRKQ